MSVSGRRITVVGGSGFIGRYVVRRLARRGWVVRVAVRDPAGALFLKTAGDVGQIVPMRADLGDAAALAAAIEGADAVVNLVGILFEKGARSFQSIHADGPALIGRLAAQGGAERVVHVSAIGANANAPARYAQSKAAGEAALRQAFAGATILRPSIVFGPEDHFFNRFARIARFSPVVPLVGAETRFQPVYVDDVAAAIERALDDPAAAGRIYELGGPRVYSFRALIEYLLTVTGRKRWIVPLPFALAEFQAAFLEWLPVPPLTRDQVRLLRQDNVVGPGAAGLAALGLAATPLEAVVPGYLGRARPPLARPA